MEPSRPDDRSFRRNAVHALLAGLLALAAAFAVMQLWAVDLRQPLEPYGDALVHAVIVKGSLEEGWPTVLLHRLGAPGALDFRDFPALDQANVLVIRLLGFAIPDATILLNVFFLLTFAAVAVSAFAVSRAVGLSVPASYVVAILYSLLPYHFGRAIGHLFLSAYYMVPPAVLLALEIAKGEPLLARGRPRRAAFAIAVAVFLGSSYVYYPFFASIFFALAGVSGSLVRRSWRPLLTAGAVVAIVFATLVANHAPSILKERAEGSLEASRRESFEVELYGLKIAQLVLPISGHRVGEWAALRIRYNAAPLVSENDMSSLGLVGTAGFLVLLAWLFWMKPQAPAMNYPSAALNHLSVLNAGGVLFATIGGFASVFALVVSPQIRSVNRISVFIGFFALLAAGIAFDRLLAARGRRVAAAAALAVVVIGGLDQTSPAFARFGSDPVSETAFRRYVAAVESAVGAGGSVFQLPYYPFPERGPIGAMNDYDHFRPYLASRATAWSYGAVRGSIGDLWQKETAALEPDAMVERLVYAGFDGIWVDRRGYPDRAAGLEQRLTAATGAIPFASEDGTYAFFPLRLARYRLQKGVGADAWKAREEDALGSLLVSWRSGFSGAEQEGGRQVRWGSRGGEILVHNLSPRPRAAVIRFEVETGRDDPSELAISGDLLTERIPLGADPLLVERRVMVPPGTHAIRFHSSARPVDAPRDPRVLVFQVRGFEIRPESAAAGASSAVR